MIRDSVPPSQWRKGMLIGAGVGVLASGYAYELGKNTGDTQGSFNPLGVVLLMGICSLIGGLIGSGFH
jgi:hypothetical protein